LSWRHRALNLVDKVLPKASKDFLTHRLWLLAEVPNQHVNQGDDYTVDCFDMAIFVDGTEQRPGLVVGTDEFATA
jgi:hypothetical protein